MTTTISQTPESKFVQYIRDKHNNPRGVMVAVVDISRPRLLKLDILFVPRRIDLIKNLGLNLLVKEQRYITTNPLKKLKVSSPILLNGILQDL